MSERFTSERDSAIFDCDLRAIASASSIAASSRSGRSRSSSAADSAIRAFTIAYALPAASAYFQASRLASSARVRLFQVEMQDRQLVERARAPIRVADALGKREGLVQARSSLRRGDPTRVRWCRSPAAPSDGEIDLPFPAPAHSPGARRRSRCARPRSRTEARSERAARSRVRADRDRRALRLRVGRRTHAPRATRPGQHQRLALHRNQLPPRRGGDILRREKRRNLDERALRMSRQVGLDLRCASDCLRLDRGVSRLWRTKRQNEDTDSQGRRHQTPWRTSPTSERTCTTSDVMPPVCRATSRGAYSGHSSRLGHLGVLSGRASQASLTFTKQAPCPDLASDRGNQRLVARLPVSPETRKAPAGAFR